MVAAAGHQDQQHADPEGKFFAFQQLVAGLNPVMIPVNICKPADNEYQHQVEHNAELIRRLLQAE
jgi:hypothetical protein